MSSSDLHQSTDYGAPLPPIIGGYPDALSSVSHLPSSLFGSLFVDNNVLLAGKANLHEDNRQKVDTLLEASTHSIGPSRK